MKSELGAYNFSGGRLWGTRELMYSFAITLLCSRGPTQEVTGD